MSNPILFHPAPDREQPRSPYWQIQQRINTLIDCLLAPEHLTERLQDLPVQFVHPQPRPWQTIDWQTINAQQIIDMETEVFLSILIGAINTEAPIRQYTQTSRQYLQALHPPLAQFVGGTVNAAGVLIEPGLWEKEERQHTPALLKVYTQLTGEKALPTVRTARSYRPSDHPYEDLYRHGLHRVATEYGATCLYLWLMAHTTGSLQAVLAELAQDEINHMTKFLGFGLWAFPDSSLIRMGLTLMRSARLTYSPTRSSLTGTLHRMRGVLGWHGWSWMNRSTFAFTCFHVLHRLCRWSHRLTPADLADLFGPSLGQSGALCTDQPQLLN